MGLPGERTNGPVESSNEKELSADTANANLKGSKVAERETLIDDRNCSREVAFGSHDGQRHKKMMIEEAEPAYSQETKTPETVKVLSLAYCLGGEHLTYSTLSSSSSSQSPFYRSPYSQALSQMTFFPSYKTSYHEGGSNPRLHEWHEREKHLPQHDPYLSYHQGRVGRYIRFSNQIFGACLMLLTFMSLYNLSPFFLLGLR